MSDFSFTATAQCDFCGNLLSSSDEDCDECSDEEIEQHMFRRITSEEDKPAVITVEATGNHKWYKLESEMSDDWIAYEWLGPRWSVQNMVGSQMFETIEDVPKRAMSFNAPDDVGES